MCGRAKLPDDVSEIKLDLKIDFDEIGDYRPRWNAAPTSKLPVVISKAGTRILTLCWRLSTVACRLSFRRTAGPIGLGKTP
jgi:putative SOS response-associated peptidase YedK